MEPKNSFKKFNRLITKSDFQNMRIESRFFSYGVLVFYYKKNNLGNSRLGLGISKKFGPANKRNHLKRKIREVFRSSSFKAAGFDCVIAPNFKKIRSNKMSYETIFEEVDSSVFKYFDYILKSK